MSKVWQTAFVKGLRLTRGHMLIHVCWTKGGYTTLMGDFSLFLPLLVQSATGAISLFIEDYLWHKEGLGAGGSQVCRVPQTNMGGMI